MYAKISPFVNSWLIGFRQFLVSVCDFGSQKNFYSRWEVSKV